MNDQDQPCLYRLCREKRIQIESEVWDDAAIQRIRKIHDKLLAGKKLTKLEDARLEYYDQNNTTADFNLTIGLNRDFSASEEQTIINVCVEAVRKLGYHDIFMSGGNFGVAKAFPIRVIKGEEG